MKFITVMDMWLLLINIGMLGCLIYVVRNMVRLMKEFYAFRNMELIDKELRTVLSIIRQERDNNTLQIAEELGFYDDLIDRIEERRTSNIIEGTTPK